MILCTKDLAATAAAVIAKVVSKHGYGAVCFAAFATRAFLVLLPNAPSQLYFSTVFINCIFALVLLSSMPLLYSVAIAPIATVQIVLLDGLPLKAQAQVYIDHNQI